MSEHEQPVVGVPDEDLPQDLVAGEDNPLAEGLDPDADDTPSAEDLDLHGGTDVDERAGETGPGSAEAAVAEAADRD